MPRRQHHCMIERWVSGIAFRMLLLLVRREVDVGTAAGAAENHGLPEIRVLDGSWPRGSQMRGDEHSMGPDTSPKAEYHNP